MAVIKKIGIKNSSGTGYDSRDIGAEAENIVVSYNSSGDISDTSDVSTTGTLKDALTTIKGTADGAAPKSHASSSSEYGAASTSNYGHVKINASSGLTVSDGAIGVNFANDGSAEDTTAVVRANDSRLSDKRNNENAVTFSDGLSTPTTKDYDGSSTLTVTYSDVGAAPTSHASTATTYGAATSSAYGHVKPGTGLAIASSTPGVLNVSYGTTSTTACAGNDSRLSDARTPKSHAATTTSYGGGTASNYGHVMLTDTYSVTTPSAATNGAATSIAASAYALQQAYSELNSNLNDELYYTTTTTENLNRQITTGFISSGATRILFMVFLRKRIPSNATVSFSELQCIFRYDSFYIGGSTSSTRADVTNLSNCSYTYAGDFMVRAAVTFSSAVSNAKNNSYVSVDLVGKVTITV